MNHGIDIFYGNGVFVISIYEINALPFDIQGKSYIDKFVAKDEIELHTILLKEGYYDKLKDND